MCERRYDSAVILKGLSDICTHEKNKTRIAGVAGVAGVTRLK